MKTTIGIAILGALAAAALSAEPVRGGMVGVAGDEAALRRVADAYAAAIRAGDAGAVAAVFADDAVEMPPGHPAIRGREAIAAYYRELFANVRFVEFALAHDDVRSLGDFAFLAGSSRQTIEAGGGRHSDTGKYLVVLRRVGGTWKVVDASYSADGPCPPGAPGPR
jgi:uncharacterized protein (TIGR02246 family)